MHLLFHQAVAGLPHQWHPAVLDDELRQGLRGLHVKNDGSARLTLQQVARQQGQQPVSGDVMALFIDEARAVGVAIEGEAEVGAGLQHHGLQVPRHLRVFGVGQVVGVGAVGLAIEAMHGQAERAQHWWHPGAAQAVAGIEYDG